jgi:hypothetical protein
MIGISLSRCVRDILAGNMELDDVDMILTGTRIISEQDLEFVCDLYLKNYWGNNLRGVEVVHKLFASKRIYQPRVDGKHPPHIIGGKIWYNSIEELNQAEIDRDLL